MRKVRARYPRTFRTEKGLVPIFIAAVVLSAVGVMVYSLDDSYLSSKFNLVAYAPDRVLAGQDVSILVMTIDEDGTPLANEHVEVYLEKDDVAEQVWSGRTDSAGMAAPVLSIPSGTGKAKIIVESGPERTETGTVLDNTIRTIITTDKPIYQPGQVIHMRALTYAGTNPLPQESDVLLEVVDPNGDKIFKKLLTPNEFGIVSYDFALSDQLIQGTYTISATVDDDVQTKAVIVKEYVLPKFRVDVLGLDDWYEVGRSISGVVSAEYFFGKVVEGTVSIEANLYLGVWTPFYSTDGTLEGGEFGFTLPAVTYTVGLTETGGNGYLQVNFTVEDTGGHVETRSKVIAIAPSSVVLSVLTDSCVPGYVSEFNVIARTPNGAPLADYSIGAYLYIDDDRRYIGSNSTDSRGVAKFRFTYQGETAVMFCEPGSRRNAVYVDLSDISGLKVVSDKAYYDVGEVGSFQIFYSGQSFTTNVYYDVVSRGYVVDRGVAQLSGGVATVSVAMTPDMEPFAQVRVYKIEKDMRVIRDAVTFGVGSSNVLSVDVSVEEDVYGPRDAVGLEMSVLRYDEPVIAALGISVVDEAVYEVGSMFSGFEEIIFGLDEAFIEPQYQLLTYVYTGSGSLPSETESVVSELDDARMASTWPSNVLEASELKEDAIRGFWYSMYLCLGVMAIALVRPRVSSKRRGSATVAVVLVLVIASGGAAVVGGYMMISGFGTSGSSPVPLMPRDTLKDELTEEFLMADGSPLVLGPKDTAYGDYTSDAQDSPLSKPTIVRQYFPETWYWTPCLVTDDGGLASVSLTAPDSITSWKVDVVASTSDGVVGTGSTSVTVFQPFFVEPNVPTSVVRGDEFPLSVIVYNYLNTTQTVNITLVDEPWFELVSNQIQSIVVPANYVSSVSFTIIADKVGWHTVTVYAESPEASDAVVRPIKIDPDGTKVETLYNGELCNDSVVETLLLSADRVEGSENAWVKIQGGIDAVFLEGVDEFIRHVSGCGEQSLSMLSIDILAYDTVMRIGATPEKMFTYESIVNQGIQHELMYLVDAKNGEGRGIVWFPGDRDVHPWLTSWGLIAFQDAINAGFGLDEDIIADMQSWLMSIQNDDGSWEFPDWGIYEFNNPLLRSKEIAATGYIARALLHSGVPGTDPHMTKAVDYIEANAHEVWDDPFSLSLSLLLLKASDGDAGLKASIADQLEELKMEDGNTCYWTSSTSLISDTSTFSRGTRVIETTGYAAMALSGIIGHVLSVEGAIRYLLNNRGALGGWSSTQDTVVAFHALRDIADRNTIENVTVEVSVNGEEVASLAIDEFQSDVTFLVDLRPFLTNVSEVEVQCTGIGSVLYSIYLEQFVPWPDEPQGSEDLVLTVTYDVTEISVTDTVTAHLYLMYDGPLAVIKMILVDLRAPMGLAFVPAEFESLRSSGVISSFDTNDRQVVVYLTDVESGVPVEFDYSLVAEMPIKSTVQGIDAWDMYDPDGLWSETLPVEFEVT
ncbi:MAG: hypothetical protein JSV90_06110 [Methanobacteriota archaeon]|nr:MAG: hypothetical protein JSV90_06110 [Euryarchaeota archaeon]